mmetsp:Transcript_10987/g.67933  ORF Transcript_10987/g.67933 Transcript_10987/m.67933 type:complete len:86 (+) Transcript_10987:152-409(+)
MNCPLLSKIQMQEADRGNPVISKLQVWLFRRRRHNGALCIGVRVAHADPSVSSVRISLDLVLTRKSAGSIVSCIRWRSPVDPRSN